MENKLDGKRSSRLLVTFAIIIFLNVITSIYRLVRSPHSALFIDYLFPALFTALFFFFLVEIFTRLDRIPLQLKRWNEEKLYRGYSASERFAILRGLVVMTACGTYFTISPLKIDNPGQLYFGLYMLLVAAVFSFTSVYLIWLKWRGENAPSGKFIRAILGYNIEEKWSPRRKINFVIFMATIIASTAVAEMLPRGNVVGPVFLFLVLTGAMFSMFAYAVDRVEQEKLKQELQSAHDMQMGLMPKEDPIIKGFDISGICVPAREVGGDFYDYVWLDKKKMKLGITIADVSGKSMKAAMTAVMTSGMLYSEVVKSQSPREILARINRPLYLRTDKRVFTTMAFAAIDVKKRSLIYSSAGHLPPMIVQKSEVNYLKAESTGLPLGIQEELVYKEARLKLQRGDAIIFYTDGIPEAMNEQKEQYGTERLEALVKNVTQVSARDIREKILADVSAFTGNAEQHDDMTVVAVKVL